MSAAARDLAGHRLRGGLRACVALGLALVVLLVLTLAGCAGPDGAVDGAPTEDGTAASAATRPLGIDAFLAAVVGQLAPAMAAAGSGEGGVGFVVEPVSGTLEGTPLAGYLADRLSMALAASTPGLHSVVNEREREELYAALGHQASELYDQETTAVLGRWLGHRWSVSGRAYARGEGAEISLVATDLQTGEALRTGGWLDTAALGDLLASVPPAEPAPITARIGWEVEVPEVAAGPASAEDFWSLGVPTGTRVRFTLSTDRDAHALVFARGSSGRGLLLLPNGRVTTPAMRAGRAVTVPDRDLDPLAFVGAPGQEEFFVVVSPEPLHDVPILAEVLGSPRLQADGGELRVGDGSYVSAAQTAAWVAVLDELEREGRRWRGALEAAERMGAGEQPAAVATRDLGNPVVGPRQSLTPSRAVQHAEITSSGLTVVRFTVDHDG